MPKATAQHTGPSSDRPQPTPTRADGFGLSGPSTRPDPRYNAYRKDLADIALAGEVLASHYAEPVARVAPGTAMLRTAPFDAADEARQIAAGETFELLEDSVGWAWGYAASDHRVGYIRSEALAPAS